MIIDNKTSLGTHPANRKKVLLYQFLSSIFCPGLTKSFEMCALHHFLKSCEQFQWRIQDSPEGVHNSRVGCANPLSGQRFAENCMKMKEIALRSVRLQV